MKSTFAEEPEKFPQPVNAVALSPDGKTFASAHVDGVTRLWDATTGKIRYEFPAYSRSVADVAYSPDGKLVASLSWNQTYRGAIREHKPYLHEIRIWKVATGELYQTIPLEIDPKIPKGLYPKGIYPSSRNDGGLTVAFLPNKTDLVTTGHSDRSSWLKDVWVWDISAKRTPKVLTSPLPPGRLLRQESGALTLAVSPDGRFIATASAYFSTKRGEFGLSSTIRLWNVKDGKIVKEQNVEVRCGKPNDGVGRPTKPQSSIPLFASDGKQLFVVLHSGEIAILEIPSLKETRRIKISKEPEREMALTAILLPKDHLLVAHGTMAYLVHPENGEVKSIQFNGLDSPITALAVSSSSDPQRIAVGCLDGTLGLWDLDTQKRLVEAHK